MSAGIGSAPRRRRAPGPPRDRTKARLLRLYAAHHRRFGPQRWWPGRSPYEIAVGAVPTQHAAWVNAARAIAALRARRLLTPARVAALEVGSLARVIRPAGTPRVKARRVQVDEIWSFTYAKNKNVEKAKKAPEGAGDTWTWTALDSDTKLLISWLVAKRYFETGEAWAV